MKRIAQYLGLLILAGLLAQGLVSAETSLVQGEAGTIYTVNSTDSPPHCDRMGLYSNRIEITIEQVSGTLYCA